MEINMNDPEIPLPTTTGDVGDGGGGGLGVEDSDRFSNLPVSVAKRIFSFLDDVDAIDVIRTSVVARSWRHLWTSMTCLNFNIDNPVWSNPPDWLPSDEKFTEYKDYVNWIMMSQDSSIRVKRSSLFYFNYGNDYTVNRWMEILSQREVKTICLTVGLVSSPVDLPYSLFTCNSLLSLQLHFRSPGVLNLPTFASFSSLESLFLQHTEFSDSVLLRNFILNCPRLKTLCMIECGFREFENLDISSSTLQTLIISNNCRAMRDEDCLMHCEVNVACPSLVQVSIGLKKSASDFTFQETNCLRRADIFLGYPSPVLATLDHYRTLMSKIIRQFCNVEEFTLAMPFYHFLRDLPNAEPRRFAASFNNLKSLCVFMGMNKWYMQSIINMLNCSPILETLEVHFNTLVVGLDPWNIPNDAISCLRNHLKTVEINEFENVVNEIEFVRFLLEYGQKLQKMSIIWKRNVERSDEIVQRIYELPAASSSVEVTFHAHVDPTT